MIGEGKGDARGGNHVGQSVGFVAHPGSRHGILAVEDTAVGGGAATVHRAGRWPADRRTGWRPARTAPARHIRLPGRSCRAAIPGPRRQRTWRALSKTVDSAEFLDANKPTYIGGLLETFNSRLYGFW